MKGLFIHTVSIKQDLQKILASEKLGDDPEPLGKQFPDFESRPLVFCSYFCEGYAGAYTNKGGIIFETDAPSAYACPVDNFELMRDGAWIPGYDRFVFPTVYAMLEKYPSFALFKKAFQEHFRSLKPVEVFPNCPSTIAQVRHRADYCLSDEWNSCYNEITFDKPLHIRNIERFARTTSLLNRLKKM